VLDGFIVDKIEDVQLFTIAHHQERFCGDLKNRWSWFDLVILDSPEATVPRFKDGRSLVWRSHDVDTDLKDINTEQRGKLFNSHDEILKLLEVRLFFCIGRRSSPR
jgi:hypothetical protein